MNRWYADGQFRQALRARWTQLRRDGFVARTLTAISRDARALQSAQVRNLRRWPVLGFAPVSASAPDAALRGVYRAEAARLRTWVRIRAGWMTANLPRIGRIGR